MEVIRVGFNDWWDMRSKAIGGNFMAVDRSRPVVREQPWSTSGNQKWNGASPSFIAMAVVKIMHDVGWVIWVMSH